MQRRSVLKNLGGLMLLPAFSFKSNNDKKKPVLRVAHLTDVHLKNELDAPTKFAKCLKHVQQQPGVEMILNGGDIVFDMNKQNLDTINAQWNLWHSIIKAECSLPIHYALGNHDIWWDENNKGQIFYGKQFALDQLQIPKPYYSFIKKGW